jgi:carbon monoxide dehydrogenase subunit G
VSSESAEETTMEVKLDKRYPVQASIDQCWAVLSDIRATGACMPGAQITEQLDDTHFKGTVKAKVGPASMQFAGEIELQGLDAQARSLQMLGKGSDRGGSSASMKLAAHLEAGDDPGTSVLVGQATVTVSGKLAQFGSRLLVPVSDAMLAQFADNFRAAAAAVPAEVAMASPARAADSADSADSAALAADSPVDGVAAAPDAMVPAADAAGVAFGRGSTAPSHSPASAPEVAPAPAPEIAAAAPGSPPPGPAAPANELNALSLMWTVIKGWVAGLFGRKG